MFINFEDSLFESVPRQLLKRSTFRASDENMKENRSPNLAHSLNRVSSFKRLKQSKSPCIRIDSYENRGNVDSHTTMKRGVLDVMSRGRMRRHTIPTSAHLLKTKHSVNPRKNSMTQRFTGIFLNSKKNQNLFCQPANMCSLDSLKPQFPNHQSDQMESTYSPPATTLIPHRTLDTPLIDQTLGSHDNILFRMHNFLYKLFMNMEMTEQDVDLNPIERKIAVSVYKKKKFAGYSRMKFSADFFNRGRQSLLKKKTEDGLKFVFKKAIKHLKAKFKKQFLKRHNLKRIKPDRLDFEFYTFHFGEIAERHGKHLESFYHFRNWKKRDSPFIPKSITRAYVSNLKLNVVFIGQIRDYLRNQLMLSFKGFNSKKIRSLIIKWEKVIEEKGATQGAQSIAATIRAPGNKLPWTMNEVTRALQDTLGYLSDS